MQISQGSMNSASNISQETSLNLGNDLLSSLATRVESALEEKNNTSEAASGMQAFDPQEIARFFNGPGQNCNSVI